MSETFTPDNLLAGDFPIVTGTVTIASGQVLPRGAVLGTVTATGKHLLCDTAAVDGSQDPTHILAEDVDASLADVEGISYLTGEFNEEQISLGGATVAADVRSALRALAIFLQAPSN